MAVGVYFYWMEIKNINTANSEILIVDDVEENIKVLGHILKINQYKISVALSAREALTHLSANLPDLILLDVMMPDMNGFELCEKLKNDEKTRHIPVIFVTAKFQQEDIMIGFDLGAEDYIVKPFNPSELLARVNVHLELKKSRDLIKAQNKELLDLNESKNKFFSIIAHDIRNPVSSIYGFSELLEHNYAVMQEEERRESIHILFQSVAQLKEMIEHLLEWGKMQMNMIDFNPQYCNVKEMAQMVFHYLAVQAEVKKIRFQESLPWDAEIYADPNMLKSILSNLISNAVKFSKHTGVVSLEFNETETSWEIKVSDQGTGMSEETKTRLFKLETHVSRRGTEGEKGAGIGLILSNEFAAKHGGKIVVESKLNEGSSFIVVLPKNNRKNWV